MTPIFADATSAAFSATTAAEASAAAEAARRAECAVTMRGFVNDHAAVEQMRSYASCVYDVYGSGTTVSGFDLFALKIAALVLLLGFVGGAVYGWRESYGGDRLIDAFMFGLGGVLAGLIVNGLALIVLFVFGAV